MLKRKEFFQVVRNCWDVPVEPYGMLRFLVKLRRLKVALRLWNKTAFGNVFDNVKRTEADLKEKEERFDASQDETDLVQLNLSKAVLLSRLAEEEIYWQQKARCKWLKEGDTNTKFFHSILVEKQAKMAIHRIKNTEGQWLDREEDIVAHVEDFYKKLLSEEDLGNDDQVVNDFLEHIPQLIKEEDNVKLLRPVEIEEVKAAVFDLDADSAPAGDGFSGAFYCSCWDIISSDLHAAVLEFFSSVPIPRANGSTLIALIPKTDSHATFSDFHPIGLCNFVNKIRTKILCNRLKPLLPIIISEEQITFLAGRDIADNVLLAQDMGQFIDRKTRGKILIFKLDMVKAFDRVSCVVLERLLVAFGFQ